MSVEHSDEALQNVLDWALERMKKNGYDIASKVAITSDPTLTIMGYAKKKDGIHYVVVADWALDSEMLGGLVLHELSHIYATERRIPSHDPRIMNRALTEIGEREGLTEREVGYLVDAYNHLQNMLVDDMVFKSMDEKDIKLTRRFFSGWISELSSGNPSLDAAMLVRNAFAIASLKRHGIDEEDEDMTNRNRAFTVSVGNQAEDAYEWMEGFLENASAGWNEREFTTRLSEYLERVVSLMREDPALNDLR
jgi:hypothetical protein